MSDTYEELGSLENEPSQEGRVLAGHLLLKYCITYFSLIKGYRLFYGYRPVEEDGFKSKWSGTQNTADLKQNSSPK